MNITAISLWKAKCVNVYLSSYKNRTGTLRKSNKYSAQDDGLELRNEAEYASFVESKGYEVLTGAALFAEKRLKEEIK